MNQEMSDICTKFIIFSDHSPVLAFWAIVALAIVAYGSSYLIALAFNRLCRTVMVCLRGWPPQYLDADGDFWAHHLAEASRINASQEESQHGG